MGSAAAVPAHHRARHKPSCLGTSLIDVVSLGRARQHPHLHQCASGVRQCERSRSHSLALAQDKLPIPYQDAFATLSKWRRKRPRRNERQCNREITPREPQQIPAFCCSREHHTAKFRNPAERDERGPPRSNTNDPDWRCIITRSVLHLEVDPTTCTCCFWHRKLHGCSCRC